MYSLMSHVDLTQGVFYPMGGLSAVAQGMRRLAEEQGWHSGFRPRRSTS